MLKRLLLCTVCLVLTTATLLADEWHQNFAVTGTPDVRVTTKDGAVSFRNGDSNQVGIQVTTQDWKIAPNQVRITPHQNGNSIELDVYVPNGPWINFGINHRSVHIDL